MRRTPVVLAALAALVACAATAAAPPLALQRIVVTRQAALVTLRIQLNTAWRSALLQPGSGTQLQVYYDTRGDRGVDYVGNIVYLDHALTETIAGHNSSFEPVPVGRPNASDARLTHPVDVMFPHGTKRGTLRIAVALISRGKTQRLPPTGWFVVGPPPKS